MLLDSQTMRYDLDKLTKKVLSLELMGRSATNIVLNAVKAEKG